MVAALPVLLMNPKTSWARITDPPTARPESEVGVDFLIANGPRSTWWIPLARWTCIPFSLLGACTCFAWASRLFGKPAGLMAAALWCFSPYILGYAALIVTDAHGAAVGVAAFYTYWLWLRQPEWHRSAIAGVLLGVAQLTKFTFLIFYPLLPILWLVYRHDPRTTMRSARWLAEAGMLFVLMVVSICVLNFGYTFEGSFRRLGDLRFHTTALTGAANLDEIPPAGGNRFSSSWTRQIPVPLPENYVQGIDLQLRDFEKGIDSYLGGKWSDHGWWYYYLYALAIKVPLGTWCLVMLAAGATIFDRRYSAPWRDELVVLAPGLSILMIVSSQTGFSVHSRYAIPLLPFLFIWASKVARAFEMRAIGARHRVLAAMVALAATWSVSSSLWFYPNSLSYFNELVGGPKGGPKHLLNSNIDWSQDMLYLKDWLDEHPSVRLDGAKYYGNGSATLLGIPKTPTAPPAAQLDMIPSGNSGNEFGPKPGWYAMSVNVIYSRARNYRYFLHFEPVAMAGYSIYIYHITLDEANRVRRELGLPELP